MTYTVTQEARDAAANFYRKHLHREGEVLVADHMQAGKIDESPLVKAFAKFEAETLERAAEVAESLLVYDAEHVTQHNEACDEIAAAIRNLKGKSDE